jgi:hypothetical protein
VVLLSLPFAKEAIMGAMPWENRTAWMDDPADALKAIQRAELEAQGDLRDQIQTQLEGAREAVAATAEDDPYGLAEHYAAELERLERIASQPIPTDLDGRLHLLRTLHESGGEGIGNVLDVTGVSQQGGFFVTKVLGPDELQRTFGTDRPASDWKTQVEPDFFDKIGRGESVCFPLFADDETDPIEWCFFGYSVD